jgi:hypothetical protein
MSSGTEDTMTTHTASLSTSFLPLTTRRSEGPAGSARSSASAETTSSPATPPSVVDLVEQGRRASSSWWPGSAPSLPVPGLDLAELYRSLTDGTTLSDAIRTLGEPLSSKPAKDTTTTQTKQPTTGAEPMLRRGDASIDVWQLQRQLRARGYPVAVDGRFGPETERAVKAFQNANGLVPDGIVGPKTRAAIAAAPTTTTPPTTTPPTTTPPTTSPTKGSVPNRTAVIERTVRAGERNQMVTGKITVNGRTYDFRSGGHGRGSLPPGTYTVTRHMDSRSTRGMTVDGVGYSFALSDKYDSRVGDLRELLRIHPDGGSAGTQGCIGIVGDAETQRRFRADMLAELAKNGGSIQLVVR